MQSVLSKGIKVKGLGAICAAGRKIEDIFEAIKNKRDCFSKRPDFLFPLGWIDEEWIRESPVPLKNWRDAPRIAKISVLAAHDAKQSAGWGQKAHNFFWGTARGWSVSEDAPWPQKLLWTPWTSVPGYISGAIGNSRQILGVQAACASGAVAIIHAAQTIVTGNGKTAIGGGADAPLSFEQINPMRQMRMLAADCNDGKKKCVPFSLNPRGITPAEGAAFLALENNDGNWQSGEIELVGWAWCSDGHARWGENANQIGDILDQAIEMAGCAHNDIGAVWGHGSGTAANDNGEWQALETWSKKRRTKPLVLLTSKGVTGHAFGATSAIEAALACFALKHGEWPPSMVSKNEMRKSDYLHLLSTHTSSSSPWLMTLSMGFWGEIAALVFKRH